METNAGDDGGTRTGNVWTTTAHALTAIVGSGILALPWSVGQLGWILGPFFLVFFAGVTYYVAILLCDCYRTPHPINGRRNHTYMDAVRSLLRTLATAIAHAFTAVVGAGILALPWSVAQLGWILGPFVLVFFALITYYTAILQCDCYRTPDPVHGRRNYTYIDAVRNILGPRKKLMCAVLQYTLLWGTMIGYTVTTAISVALLPIKHVHCANKDQEKELSLDDLSSFELVMVGCPKMGQRDDGETVVMVPSHHLAILKAAQLHEQRDTALLYRLEWKCLFR
ncbi:hypothetical protein GH714_016248 [Hevea brasiliensis]|uniref:Amino acid transporter transmembrane domain-containing protein n=1 Tax=Hevea brasiliensis TaxID=3981 RepID=A0A6A6KTX6_HEVBR|nr:hypothetical protein GH714_016248 [Hevea brasiliensis]